MNILPLSHVLATLLHCPQGFQIVLLMANSCELAALPSIAYHCQPLGLPLSRVSQLELSPHLWTELTGERCEVENEPGSTEPRLHAVTQPAFHRAGWVPELQFHPLQKGEPLVLEF